MELKSGTIRQIEDGIVKTGHFIGKPYKTITLTTGNKLSAFELEFIADIEIGKEYTFPVEQKGSYTNIVGTVTPVIQQEEGVTPNYPGVTPITKFVEKVAKPTEFKPVDKDTAIRKAVALKAAVEFLVGISVVDAEKFSIGNVIETAKKFEEYLR